LSRFRTLLAGLAVAGLVAACGGTGGSPSPLFGTPAPPGGSPTSGLSNPAPTSPETSPSTSPGAVTSPLVVAEASPGVGSAGGASPSPGLAGEAGPSLAVVDRGGNLTTLDTGQCQLTTADGQPVLPSQPITNATLALQFQATTTPGTTLPGAATPSPGLPGEASPSPVLGGPGGEALSVTITLQPTSIGLPMASPSPGLSNQSSGAVPFLVSPGQVSVQSLPDGGTATGTNVIGGIVAPNGLSGYLTLSDTSGQPVTIGFACGGNAAGALPGSSPVAPGTSPALPQASPSGSPAL
jgi:hypothetical protein